MDSWKSNKSVFWILATPGTLWLLLFFILPLGILFAMSFGSKAIIDGEISATQFTYFTGITNYLEALNPLYMQILLKTIFISAIATIICLLIAYPIAFGICFAPNKWKPLLLLLVVLPFWINLLIRTYALIAVFRSQGYLNQVFGSVDDIINFFTTGISLVIFFVTGVETDLGVSFQIGPFEMLYNNVAVVFGLVYVYMPFMVLPLYATIERLDKSFLEASLDLGATQFTTFWKVTVPLTMPGIVTGIILVFIPCLGTFLTSDLLGGANAILIGNIIERQFKAANNWPLGAAISFLLMFATFIALAIRAYLASRSKGVGV